MAASAWMRQFRLDALAQIRESVESAFKHEGEFNEDVKNVCKQENKQYFAMLEQSW